MKKRALKTLWISAEPKWGDPFLNSSKLNQNAATSRHNRLKEKTQ
jgi:hypothetical protein